MIPLRPLSLSDIFNGAVGYVRANPKATLGLTTVVVLITQILSLLSGGWRSPAGSVPTSGGADRPDGARVDRSAAAGGLATVAGGHPALRAC